MEGRDFLSIPAAGFPHHYSRGTLSPAVETQFINPVPPMRSMCPQVIAAPGLKVRIRKMACHNGLLFGRDKAAEREAAREEAAKAKAKTGSATKATATGRKRPVRGRGPSGPTANKRHKAAVPAEGGS